MNTKALAQVLTTQADCTEKGGVVEIGEETALTLYVSIGSESLVVGSVEKVEILEELVMATTAKGEVYAVVAQDVRALRFGKGAKGRRTGLI